MASNIRLDKRIARCTGPTSSRRFYRTKLRRFSRVLSQGRRIIETDKTRDFPEKAMPFLFLFVDREWLTLTPEEPSSPQGEVVGGKKRALPRRCWLEARARFRG